MSSADFFNSSFDDEKAPVVQNAAPSGTSDEPEGPRRIGSTSRLGAIAADVSANDCSIIEAAARNSASSSPSPAAPQPDVVILKHFVIPDDHVPAAKGAGRPGSMFFHGSSTPRRTHVILRSVEDRFMEMMHYFHALVRWRNCTPRKIKNVISCLCVTAVVATIFALVVVAVNTHKRPADTTTPPDFNLNLDKRTLDAWRVMASRIHNNTDYKTDPCVDFYQHACGGWLATHPIPDDASRVGTFDAIQITVEEDLYDIANAGWPVVGTWYDNCMDTTERDRVGVGSAFQPMFALIQSVDSSRRLSDALARMHAIGVGALFSVYTEDYPRNVSRYMLTLGHPETTVTHDVLTANRTRDTMADRELTALHKYAVSLFQSIDFLAIYDVDDALRIEQTLAKHAMSPADMRDVDRTLNIYKRAQMTHIVPHFDWDMYWSTLIDATGAGWSAGAATLDKGPYLNVMDPDALAAVDGFLKADLLSWKALRTYLFYRLLVHYAPFMTTAQVAPSLVFEASAHGLATAAPLWAQCLSSLNAALGDVLSHYYVANYFPPESKMRAEQIIAAVIQSFRTQISAVAWMDAPTKAAALQKIDAVEPLVGYPTRWSSDVNFDVNEGFYLDSVIAWETSNVRTEIQALERVPNRYGWLMRTYEVNAYYDPEANDIVFPAGILQGAFFDALAPLAMNFGGIGSVVGHELSHGFDDEGRHFDASGNRRDWWSASSSAAFDTNAQCVVNLYGKFKNPSVNGQLTLGENLADIGGVRAAHGAFLMLSTSSAAMEEQAQAVRELFGMPPDQLYWKAWAGVWCEKRTPALTFQYYHEDPHSPPKWRVNGPASQRSEFAAAFGCKTGKDPMAPSKTCSIW